jgi:hypothetical protein
MGCFINCRLAARADGEFLVAFLQSRQPAALTRPYL